MDTPFIEVGKDKKKIYFKNTRFAWKKWEEKTGKLRNDVLSSGSESISTDDELNLVLSYIEEGHDIEKKDNPIKDLDALYDYDRKYNVVDLINIKLGEIEKKFLSSLSEGK